MPKNYYCDFCHCTFPDNKTNRNKHNQGRTHVQNRKLHYDWFSDREGFIRNQVNKLPCKYYMNHGYCEYGLLCKYSHIQSDLLTGQLIYPKEIIYFQSLTTPKSTKPVQQKRHRLPFGWKLKDLPPSLKPPSSDYLWEHVNHWG
ncbi:hypothetical protein G6F38_013347 [Rhizopus arrhizus]|nr:hypothetical protein G6F38_013347 [Rhizopus arrhizus]